MKYSNDRGSILVSALVLVAIMLLLGVAVLNTSSDEMKIAANGLRSAKALNLAEAGVSRAVREMGANLSWRGTGGKVSLDDGCYKVTVTGPDADGLYLVTSEGWLGSDTSPTARRKIAAKMRKGGAGGSLFLMKYILASMNYSTSVFDLWPHAAFEGNIYYNGNAEAQKNADIKPPANADMSLYPGGKAYIDATGTITVQGGGAQFGIHQRVAPLAPPTFTASELRDMANIIAPSGTIFAGIDSSYKDGDMIYVNGNASISGLITRKVIIAATGTITVTGDMTYQGSAGPIFVIGLQGINVNNGAKALGLLCTPGKFDVINGSTFTLTGALMAGLIVNPDFANGTKLTHDWRLADPANVPSLFGNTGVSLVDWQEAYY